MGDSRSVSLILSTITTAANHTALQVEEQDLFENQLRVSYTRSVRRTSGLVLVGHSEPIPAPSMMSATRREVLRSMKLIVRYSRHSTLRDPYPIRLCSLYLNG